MRLVGDVQEAIFTRALTVFVINPDQAKEYMVIFRDINRLPQFTNYYLKYHKV